jgi:hypothetical protein
LTSVKEAMHEGVDLISVPRVYLVSSGSGPHKYAVRRDKHGWTCTCTGYQFRAQKQMGYCCKHILTSQEYMSKVISSRLKLFREEVNSNDIKTQVPCPEM